MATSESKMLTRVSLEARQCLSTGASLFLPELKGLCSNAIHPLCEVSLSFAALSDAAAAG